MTLRAFLSRLVTAVAILAAYGFILHFVVRWP